LIVAGKGFAGLFTAIITSIDCLDLQLLNAKSVLSNRDYFSGTDLPGGPILVGVLRKYSYEVL
jgi:hypothetical protein